MGVTNIRRSGPVLRESLRSAHDGIDQAIADGACLLMTTMRTRISHALDGSIGQQQLDGMLDGLAKLRDARATFIDVHEGLRAIGVHQKVIAEGDWPPKIEPDDRAMTVTSAA